MPSTGWQGAKWIHTVNNWLQYYADLRVDGMSHEGNRLHIWGALALNGEAGASGGGGAQNVVNGIHGTLNGSGGSFGTNFKAGSDYHVNYDTWIDNVPSAATSATITPHYASYNNASGSSVFWTADPSWTVHFGSSGVKPDGITASINKVEWNKVTGNILINSYGQPADDPDRYIEFGIMPPSATDYGHPIYRWGIARRKTSALIVIDNNSNDLDFGPIIGMRPFKIGGYATNGTLSDWSFSNTIYHTSPAPGSITYEHQPNTSTYTVIYTPNPANNFSGYEPSHYSITMNAYNGSADAGYKEFPDATYDQPVSWEVYVPFGETRRIVGYQEYYDTESEESEIVLNNTDTPARLYGSVGNVAKKVDTLYGSVNGHAKKITKLYASVGGKTKLIYKA